MRGFLHFVTDDSTVRHFGRNDDFRGWFLRDSGLAGEDEGDVVGLLVGADPGIEGEHYLV